jgi:hypothetical protein
MNKLTTVIIDPAEPKARRVDSATINLTPLARAMMLF